MWKSYGTVAVLVDCSVRMRRGEVVVVCGPSGSGKSTLIKTINGQKPFQKGEITVNGVSVGDPATNLPKLRSRVGWCSRTSSCFRTWVTKDVTFAQQKVLKREPDDAHDRAVK